MCVTQKIQNVFDILSQIPVKGDAVDMMAMSRKLLREIYKEVGELEAKEIPPTKDERS